MKRFNHRVLIFLIFSLLSMLSQAQHMFFHLLPGFGTPFTWVGLAADANWNSGANWNTGVAPGASDTATFDGTCISNCDPTINVSINVRGVNIKNSYAGTITQASSSTITIGSAGWTQAAGTFSGSDANITMVKFAISNGSFNAPTATFLISATAATAADNSTLFAVTGTATTNFTNTNLKFYALCNWLDCVNYGLNVGTAMTVASLYFDYSDPTGNGYTLGWNFNSGNIITVNGDMTMQRTSLTGGLYVNNARINLNGNLYANNGAGGGNAHVYFQSAGAQSLSGVANAFAPIIHIDKPSGAVTVPSVNAGCEALIITNQDFTAPTGLLSIRNRGTIANGGTIFSTTATGHFVHNNGSVSLYTSTSYLGITSHVIDVDGSVDFNNLDFKFYDSTWYYITYTIGAGDTINVLGNLSLGRMNLTETVTYNGGTINVSGNYNIGAGTDGGSTVINVIGGVNKSITYGASAVSPSPVVTVAKPAAILTQTNVVTFSKVGQDLNISNGTYNMAGFNLTIADQLTIGASGKLICNGGSVSAAGWTVTGEVSCGSTIGITWTGLAGDHLWSTAGNWTNNTVPGASDIAIFNGVCAGANCDAQIDSNLSVRGLILNSAYTGTLTQNASRTLTIGTAGFSQAGGTFAGGDSDITVNATYVLSGGTFTATSALLTLENNSTFSGAATFIHHSGTVLVNNGSTITPNGTTFNNFRFRGSGSTHSLNGGTMIVTGILNLEDQTYGTLNSGTVEARGDINILNTGKGGSALIKINGAGAQALIATGATAYFPNMTIDKAGGSLSLSGLMRTNGNWIHTTGTVNAGASTLQFDGNSVSVPGTMTYNNVNFNAWGGVVNLSAGTMVATGTVTLNDVGGGTLNNGTVEARGDVVLLAGGKAGTALIKMNGTGAQALSATGASTWFPNMTIDKASGTLTMTGLLRTQGAWSYLAGTVDMTAATLDFQGSATITPGTMIYNNVNFSGWVAVQNLNAGTMIVTGTLTLNDVSGGSINNGTIEAQGPISLSAGGKTGNAVIKINGAGAQTLSGAGTAAYFPIINIDKASGTLTMSGTIRTNGAWIYTNGTVNAGTSTLQFDGSTNSIPGTMTYNNVTFAGWNNTHDLSAGTMIVAGTTTLTDTGTGIMNNGTIEARGNVTVTGGKTGTMNLTMNGNTSGTLNWTAGQFLTNTLTVAKTGGASLVLGGNASFSTAGRNFTISSGTMDLNSYDFAVNNVLTVSVGATLKCNGGEFTAGTLTNSGTVNCPGYATYDFNWTGAGGDTNWSTAANWQGGVAPGASDVAAFQNSTCGGTCNATISSSLNVRGVRIFSPYTGTISQATGQTITVGSRGWNQIAGTFVGGNANITYNGTLTLSGGSYTATSAITYPRNVTISGAPTFIHNNGTWTFSSANSTVTSMNTIDFNHVNFSGYELSHAISGTMSVKGNLGFHDNGGYFTYAKLNGGVIEAYGDITNSGWGKSGTTEVRIMGNPLGQTITGAVLPASVPSLKIQAGANTVNFVGTITTSSTFVFTSGNLNAAGSTLNFNEASGAGTQSITPGAATYGSVKFEGHDTAYTLNGGTLNVAENLTLSDNGSWAGLRLINSGTINVSGNATVLNNGSNGSANINFVGTTDTTLSMSGTGGFPQGTMAINKSTPAKVTLLSNSRFNSIGTQNLTIGGNSTLDMAGFSLTVANNITNGGVIRRGTNPTCGTITQGGSLTGNAPICP